MISTDQNQALQTVGNAALSNRQWEAYAAYCYAREKGLRKEAFQHLAVFLSQAEKWALSEKIAFVRFLFPFLRP